MLRCRFWSSLPRETTSWLVISLIVVECQLIIFSPTETVLPLQDRRELHASASSTRCSASGRETAGPQTDSVPVDRVSREAGVYIFRTQLLPVEPGQSGQ
ncbi:hypothetical protein N657DRAFT_364638 [Parathielavia appendiculata]|uniref:Uncharacterized protein n=1 Tax=Parathielavia appendiculata TaxID=2587402 RepID=A0AAN6Z5H1_9PEZI|nr:hypothetical protein N657DRAFT_364638 [Parathielavia appendiculata]